MEAKTFLSANEDTYTSDQMAEMVADWSYGLIRRGLVEEQALSLEDAYGLTLTDEELSEVIEAAHKKLMLSLQAA